MSRFVIPKINCLVQANYLERRRNIDFDHYPRIETARRILTNITRPLHRDEAAVIRRLRWARRNINYYLKRIEMSSNDFFNHSIINCTCTWCIT